jgi:hypothetical protein
MGILDDAIREHLDLKRRRGADPAEVERAEREALGPVRRNPVPADAAPDEDEADPEGGFAYDQAAEDGWSPDSVQQPADEAAEPVYKEPAAAEPVDDEPRGEPADDELPEASVEPPPAFAAESDPAPESFPTAPPSARPVSDLGGGETEEYDVEELLAAEEKPAEPAGDDVLEETPEFLQDTPDHDRLWFEQRPPKDFDFDE